MFEQHLVDERVGPVFHLAGGVSFGVDVGDLLELERALQRNGEVDAAAQEEEILGAEQEPDQLVIDGGVREHLLQFLGQAEQLMRQAARIRLIERLADLAQVHGQQEQGRQLRGESLGGGDRDLRAGVGEDGS
jgi:hypothetical protein